jgi:hypothetical protein
MQRQLQRSQYQMQYSRPVQAALSVVFLFCLIGELFRFVQILFCCMYGVIYVATNVPLFILYLYFQQAL